MLHELRHHIELRAGVYDLELEDLRQLEEFRRQLGLGSREDAGDDPADRWDEEDLDEWDEPEEPGEPGEEEVPRRGRRAAAGRDRRDRVEASANTGRDRDRGA